MEDKKADEDKKNSTIWKDITNYTNSKLFVDFKRKNSVVEDSVMNKNNTLLGAIKEIPSGANEDVTFIFKL